MDRMRRLCGGGRQPTMEELAAVAGTSLRTLYRMFGSRQTLLRTLDCEPVPSPRERLLGVALEQVGRRGMAALSMDELAALAAVSRATLYRLFPGRDALFRELILAYAPWEPLARAIDGAEDPAPELVAPRVARALAGSLSGRTGLLLRMVSAIIESGPGGFDEVQRLTVHGLGRVLQYLEEQMAAGRLRRMHPIVAFQLLAGPIAAHLLTRPLSARLAPETSEAAVVDEMVAAWLRAMAPEI